MKQFSCKTNQNHVFGTSISAILDHPNIEFPSFSPQNSTKNWFQKDKPRELYSAMPTSHFRTCDISALGIELSVKQLNPGSFALCH